MQIDQKNQNKLSFKRKSSRNENRDAGIDIDELEAETARIHRQVVAERNSQPDIDHRHKEKRTVSDNTRPIFEQSKSSISNNTNQGVKVILDKS